LASLIVCVKVIIPSYKQDRAELTGVLDTLAILSIGLNNGGVDAAKYALYRIRQCVAGVCAGYGVPGVAWSRLKTSSSSCHLLCCTIGWSKCDERPRCA
jgi:hypothetical protein